MNKLSIRSQEATRMLILNIVDFRMSNYFIILGTFNLCERSANYLRCFLVKLTILSLQPFKYIMTLYTKTCRKKNEHCIFRATL